MMKEMEKLDHGDFSSSNSQLKDSEANAEEIVLMSPHEIKIQQ